METMQLTNTLNHTSMAAIRQCVQMADTYAALYEQYDLAMKEIEELKESIKQSQEAKCPPKE